MYRTNVVPLSSAISVPIFIALAACGSADGDKPAEPRVYIFVNERPHDPASEEQELDEVRFGDPLHVTIDGLAPGAVFSVVSKSAPGTSRARFAAQSDGTIDLARDAPVDGEGTWAVADGEAFVWSMTDPDGDPDLAITVRVLDKSDQEIASAVVTRTQDIIVEPIDQGRSQGVFALPRGDGPFPAVLVFGGSEGGTAVGEYDAKYFASLGYASMGVGYFGVTGLPAQLRDVPVEIIEEDLALLTSDPRVDPERIVVIGSSRGGELALLVASLFPGVVRGVIAEVPSGVVWRGAASQAAWTYKGAPVPFIPYSGAQPKIQVDADGTQHWFLRSLRLADLAAADPAALEAATIRAEDIGGPVMFLSGADDQVWPSCELADIAVRRRIAAGVGDSDVVVCAPDAGHLSIGPPGWSTVDTVEMFSPSDGVFLVLGGTPQSNARALRSNDTAIRAFLER